MGKESVESRKERGRDSTSPEALEKLAADEDSDVLSAAAGNPNTPASLLEKLAADEDEDVRRGVAGNPNTPASLFQKLFEHRRFVQTASQFDSRINAPVIPLFQELLSLIKHFNIVGPAKPGQQI